MSQTHSIAMCRQSIEHIISATRGTQAEAVIEAAEYGCKILRHIEKRAALYREAEKLEREAPGIITAITSICETFDIKASEVRL